MTLSEGSNLDGPRQWWWSSQASRVGGASRDEGDTAGREIWEEQQVVSQSLLYT